ncbi:HtaA domain-containing protein [Leucobacter musarum]|uniref:HtaA domain-containing protein n=1 Tax=Leucobacter musarum TaxID=1930747 RepID=UPI0006A79438|nr:HtaA domain-containing protein [Leucobacter musarum]
MSARPRLLQVSTIVLAVALVLGGPFAGAAAWAEPSLGESAVAETDTATPLVDPEVDAAPAEGSQSTGEPAPDAPSGAEGVDVADSVGTEGEAGTSATGETSEAAEVPESSNAPAVEQPAAAAPIAVDAGSVAWDFASASQKTDMQVTALGDVAEAPTSEALVWNGGTGQFTESTGSFELAFDDADGVHLEAIDADTDADVTHVRLVSTDGATAQLLADITPSDDALAVARDVVLTTFPVTYAMESGTAHWSVDSLMLSGAGASALGAGWSADDALGRLTITSAAAATAAPGLPASDEPAPQQTTLALTARATSVVEGSAIAVQASVAPTTASGEVRFSVDGVEQQQAVVVDTGVAKASLKLGVGEHQIEASFAPTDTAKFSASKSQSLKVTVTPKVVDVDITSAQLTWGVKASFRNYIYNFTAFEGRSRLLGTTKQPVAKSEFVWSGGAGSVKSDASSATAAFGAKNGVHFESHPMEGGYALDLQFTNPQVEVSANGSGKLYLDVKSRKFEGMDAISSTYFDEKKVHVGNIQFSGATISGKTTTWSTAPVTLTKIGAEEAFGGFYESGQELDPITLSVNTEQVITSATPTSTSLAASASKVTVGSDVTVTATTKPSKVAGQVTFSAAGKQLGSAVSSRNGAAKATVSLPVGIHSITATFTPKSADYGRSVSSPVSVTVVGETPEKPPVTTPTGASGTAAGSLSWSVSDAFIAYTTCANKEAFGYSHCAKGSIETSGVGAGYLFPQASGSNWDAATQTGTVTYSGAVSFLGYGMTMFNVSNPSITVTGPTSATLSTGNTTSFGASSYQLDLGSASKSVGANGEVTWSGVPVIGSLSSGGAGGSGNQSIGLDALTFTVGSVSQVSYGSTESGADKKTYTPAASAPATTGVTVLTDADKIKPGGRIEIEASGFDKDDEGVLVVLYSDPIVLDDAAKADKNGVVRWSGTLPKDVTGTHTITIQGSSNAGAVIDIVEPKKKKKASQSQAEESAQALEAQAVQDRAMAAGFLPTAGGMALWEWWASAGGLVAIAACMTLLAIRQRRNAQ